MEIGPTPILRVWHAAEPTLFNQGPELTVKTEPHHSTMEASSCQGVAPLLCLLLHLAEAAGAIP